MSGQRFGSGGDAPRPTPEALQYGKPPNPVCPTHHVMLRVESTRKEVRYLYCPVPGCRESVCLSRHD